MLLPGPGLLLPSTPTCVVEPGGPRALGPRANDELRALVGGPAVLLAPQLRGREQRVACGCRAVASAWSHDSRMHLCLLPCSATAPMLSALTVVAPAHAALLVPLAAAAAHTWHEEDGEAGMKKPRTGSVRPSSLSITPKPLPTVSGDAERRSILQVGAATGGAQCRLAGRLGITGGTGEGAALQRPRHFGFCCCSDRPGCPVLGAATGGGDRWRPRLSCCRLDLGLQLAMAALTAAGLTLGARTSASGRPHLVCLAAGHPEHIRGVPEPWTSPGNE